MNIKISPFNNVEKVAKWFGKENAIKNSFLLEKIYKNYKNFESYHGSDGGLVDIDNSLKILFEKRNIEDLSEQIRDLFGSSLKDWQKAYTEIIALSVFENEAILKTVGWPETKTDTPPFDGLLTFSEIEIAFDIKGGMNSGLSLLEKQFETIVDEWREKNKLGKVQIEICHEGTTAQAIIGPKLKSLKSEFSKKLYSYKIIPKEAISLCVENTDKSKRICTKLNIYISPYVGAYVSGGSKAIEEHTYFLQVVMLNHANSKSSSAEKYDQKPFFLVYVKPFGSPDADISQYDLAISLRKMESDEIIKSKFPLWIGVILLDWTKVNLEKKCFLRKNTVLNDRDRNIILKSLKFTELN